MEYLDAADMVLTDADGTAAGHQIDLEPGANLVKVRVTASDAKTTWIYALTVWRTSPVLVTNRDEARAISFWDFWQAQAFTTGSRAAGYRLASVALRVGARPGNDFNYSDTHVGIWSDEAGWPNERIAALTTPSTIRPESNLLNTFTAPERVLLDPDTTYHVMVNYGLDQSARLLTARTECPSESSDDGWTISNSIRVTHTQPDPWSTFSQVLFVELRGEQLPETTTNGAPTFDDGTSTTRQVEENTATGQPVGSAVSSDDPDDHPLTYTLEGTDAGSFAIDSGTGQLKTSAPLNQETKSSYTVTADDDNGSTASITMTVDASVRSGPQCRRRPAVRPCATTTGDGCGPPQSTRSSRGCP